MEECVACKDKCCNWDLAFPLFVTPEEKKKLVKINTCHPCSFFNKEQLCDVHKDRPFDCRFFPFDILKLDGKFYWIIWKVNCPMLVNGKEKFEEILAEHEQHLVPFFKAHLDNYSQFRLAELLSKYEYEVIREVKLTG